MDSLLFGQVFVAVHFEGLVIEQQTYASQSLLIMIYQISAVKQAVFCIYVESSQTKRISSFMFYLRCSTFTNRYFSHRVHQCNISPLEEVLVLCLNAPFQCLSL